MASRKRLSKENGLEKPLISEGNNDVQQERTKRPLRKLKNIEESSNTVQWIVLMIILSLAILGLIYYYNYFQPTGSSPGKSTANVKQNIDSKQPKNDDKTTKSTEHKNEQKKRTSSSNGKFQTKKSPSSDSKVDSTNPLNDNLEPAETVLPDYPKEKSEHLKVYPKNLRERLLRLPIPPSDADRPFALEIVSADDLLVHKDYSKALEKFNELLKRLSQSPRSLYGKAMALEKIAEKRNNLKVMDSAIEYYRKVSMESFLGPEIIKEASLIRMVTLLNRREKYEKSITACKKLCDMDPDNDGYAIQLALTCIKGGKLTEAKKQLQLVLDKWPDRAIAKANLGYLYSVEGDCKSAVPLLMAGLEEDMGIKKNPAFYMYAGDCLVKLNMYNESLDLYRVAVDLGVFPSLWQRPLVYIEGLKAQPWWSVSDSGIEEELTSINNERDTILSELAPLVVGDKFEPGQTVWTLWANGECDEENCHVTPLSCDLINNVTSSTTPIKEVKVILFPSSLHISPRVGSTSNDQLRVIIPLQINRSSLTIRVGDSKRVIPDDGHDGVPLIMDESYEHELWYNSEESTATGLLMIVHLAHPQLSLEEQDK